MGVQRGPRTASDASGALLFLVFSGLLVCMAGGMRAYAQSAFPVSRIDASPLLDGTDTVHGRISIDITVKDRKGSAVTDLHSPDFTLLNNGRPISIVTVETSKAQSDPLTILLVIDDDDLSADGLVDANRVAEEYLLAHTGPLRHAVQIYHTTRDGAVELENPSMDGAREAARLANLKNFHSLEEVRSPSMVFMGPDGQAGFVNLTPRADRDKVPEPGGLVALGSIAIEQRRVPGRKLLFWIGPGWPFNRSDASKMFDTITELSTRLREARIELSIATQWQVGPGVGDTDSLLGPASLPDALNPVFAPGDIHRGCLSLQVFALNTGGEVLAATDHLADLIAKHEQQATNWYQLTFDPPVTSKVDDYHQFEVKLDRPDITARTAAGYYDQPVFYDQADFGFQSLSIAELEQKLASTGKLGDRALANEISGIELTERMSTPRMNNWMRHMRGSRSRNALIALADRSAFRDPPASEISETPEPDVETQKGIIVRVADYMRREVPRLPNFYATRTTDQFGAPTPKSGTTWKTATGDQRLQLERSERASVLYRDGQEVADVREVKGEIGREQLVTRGTFGPILISTFESATAPGGSLKWSRWEQTGNRRVAVFRYSTAPDMRSFDVGFCCLAVDDAAVHFRRKTAFHGEIAVDPETGRVFRLVVHADLEPRSPLLSSGIVVEYGSVNLGGISYFCPLRSVSLSRQRSLWEIGEWGMVFRVFAPFKTVLDDATFSQYHLFRSESRILPEYFPAPDEKPKPNPK